MSEINTDEQSGVCVGETLEGSSHHCESLSKRSTEFTTEQFKVEVSNLPKHIKYHALKQMFERYYKIEPHKIRMGDRRAYLAFDSLERRDEAIEKISNLEWKGRVLSAKQSVARSDPLLDRARGETKGLSEDVEHSESDVITKVCPLWGKDYEEQIKIKQGIMLSVLNMAKKISKLSPDLSKAKDPQLYDWIQNNNRGPCCPFDGVVQSPLKEGYRNKCEFNVGSDASVGFKMGRYKDGYEKVIRPPSNCPIVSGIMFKVLDKFHECLTQSINLRGYDAITHEGHVRQLTLRTNRNNELLAIVDIHPQALPQNVLENEISSITDGLKSIKEVVCIYVNISESNHFSETSKTLRLVYGKEYLFETLNIVAEKPLRFRVGPKSFFQINTEAAELLYKSIRDLANLNSKSAVLDIGCGTGTIGLSLADQVSFIVGIDIVSSAIEDAKMNAELNNIKNALFFAGKAEDLVGESMSILKSKLRDLGEEDAEIVAIVDPPRVGFNSSFIKFIRASPIQKIIYIACDALANPNLTALCRPQSKAFKGDPFVPTRAKAFDMFPHTKFCELVLVYERLSNNK